MRRYTDIVRPVGAVNKVTRVVVCASVALHTSENGIILTLP